MSFVFGVGLANCDIMYIDMKRVPIEGEEIYSKKFDIQLGGGIPATMINISRLNVPTKFTTFLGSDMFSNFVEKELSKNNINYQNIYDGDGIPLAVTSVIVTKCDRSFVSYKDDFDVTDAQLEKIYNFATGAKIVEMHEGYIEVYKKLKKEGTILVFDTGWHDDLSIEKYADYIELADYYTPNQVEAMKITGTKNPLDALDFLEKYFEKPIVKLDKDGVIIKENGTLIKIPVMKDVVAVDSTGAGDAFKSGFIYGLFHEYKFSDCIKFASITGGTCVQGVGALTKYVNETELLEKFRNFD